jgi:hypothetical protein
VEEWFLIDTLPSKLLIFCQSVCVDMLNRSLLRLAGPVSKSVLLRGAVRNAVAFSQADQAIFIQSEKTPNVNARKFTAHDEDNGSQQLTVLPEEYGTGIYMERQDKKQIARSPLAQNLFQLDWVKGIFLARDFVTVTKDLSVPWRELTRVLEMQLQDFYLSRKAVIEEGPDASDTSILETDSEVVATIKELMETRVRPSVQEDGGDIFYEGFDVDTGKYSCILSWH